MAMRYRCRWGACPRLLDRAGYCPEHEAERAARERERLGAGWGRPNASLYNTREWRALRAATIRAHPFCARCGIDSGLQVHHRTPPRGNDALFWSSDNLEVICKACHDRETFREIHGRRYNPR